MNVELDSNAIELIFEAIQYRIENDTHLMYHPATKSDYEDLMAVFEDEYL
jgi:hypothetical protein|tara:strand:+ start:1782 stop:1931 length:150 start_codon:yes stop_codon:yes gene_type:complete